jgi:hypothetical protein
MDMARVQDVPSEILDWSKDRPGWQRDALRRLFSAGEIGQEELDELVHLCKAARGLAEPLSPKPLAREHLATMDASSDAVSLVSLVHHKGANALAAEQTITFGTHLTIVYGPNAAGKSGYARILKQACRSRSSERILGNVLSGAAPASYKLRSGSAKAPRRLRSHGAWTRHHQIRSRRLVYSMRVALRCTFGTRLTWHFAPLASISSTGSLLCAGRCGLV